MKKYITVFAILANILFITSCSKDADVSTVSDKKVPMTFSIASAGDNSTRTYLVHGGTSSVAVYWEKGDQITIFEGGHKSGDVFTCQNLPNKYDNIGEFNGYSYEGTTYVAVYPASTNAKYDGDKNVTFTIPESQKAYNNDFDPSGAIQLGRSKAGGAIDLKHVTAALYIELEEGLQCSAISVTTGDANWSMTGTVTATVGSEGNTIDASSITGTNKVMLVDIPNEAGVYIMSIIPSTSNPQLNLSITYKKQDGAIKTYTRRFNAKSSFVVGNMYNLGKYGFGDNGELTSK